MGVSGRSSGGVLPFRTAGTTLGHSIEVDVLLHLLRRDFRGQGVRVSGKTHHSLRLFMRIYR
jgi:hypothetical protein